MTLTSTRPETGPIDLAEDRTALRREARAVLLSAAALELAVAAAEYHFRSEATLFAVILLPFAVIALVTYALGLGAGFPGRGLAAGMVVTSIAAGGLETVWGPWSWSIAYAAALIPALAALAWLTRRN